MRYPHAMRIIEILEFIKKYDIISITTEQMLSLMKSIELSSHQGKKVDQHDTRICFSLILGLTIQKFLEKEREFNSLTNSNHIIYPSDFAEMFISELKREIREGGNLAGFHFIWLGWDLSGKRPLVSPELIRYVNRNLEERILRLLDPSSPAVAMTKDEHGAYGGPRLTLLVLNRLKALPQGSQFEANFKKGRIYAQFMAIESAIGKAADTNRQIEKKRDIVYWTLWGGIILFLIYTFGFFGLIITPLYWGLHWIAFSLLDRMIFDKKLINLDEIKFDN